MPGRCSLSSVIHEQHEWEKTQHGGGMRLRETWWTWERMITGAMGLSCSVTFIEKENTNQIRNAYWLDDCGYSIVCRYSNYFRSMWSEIIDTCYRLRIRKIIMKTVFVWYWFIIVEKDTISFDIFHWHFVEKTHFSFYYVKIIEFIRSVCRLYDRSKFAVEKWRNI